LETDRVGRDGKKSDLRRSRGEGEQHPRRDNKTPRNRGERKTRVGRKKVKGIGEGEDVDWGLLRRINQTYAKMGGQNSEKIEKRGPTHGQRGRERNRG